MGGCQFHFFIISLRNSYFPIIYATMFSMFMSSVFTCNQTTLQEIALFLLPSCVDLLMINFELVSMVQSCDQLSVGHATI